MTYRVVLKQIMPRVLNSIRLNLKAVMLFLFAGEMIASTDGLAYRIALLRRHMGMDVIIPYVLWVALLLFLVDLGMRNAEPQAASLVSRRPDAMALIRIEDVCVAYGSPRARRAGRDRSGNRRRRIRLPARPDRLRKIDAAAAGTGLRAADARAGS